MNQHTIYLRVNTLLLLFLIFPLCLYYKNKGFNMKKLTSIIVALSFINLSATEYLITLDKKHYDTSVSVEDYIEPVVVPPIPPVPTESPYTEKETLLLDWKTEGDSQVVLDTSTGIEWLRITNTDGMSVAQAEALLNTTFEGWRLPTRAEVITFMQSNFPTRNLTNTPQNILAVGSDARTYGNKMGYTYNTERSYGLFKSDSSGNAIAMSGVRVGYYIYHITPQSSSNTYKHGTKGVFLVSDGGVTLSSKNNPAINIPVN